MPTSGKLQKKAEDKGMLGILSDVYKKAKKVYREAMQPIQPTETGPGNVNQKSQMHRMEE